MSDIAEISQSVKILKKNIGNKFCLMQCTGSYPAPLEEANLKVIEKYKKKFRCLVGYSDHVIGNLTAIASIPFGISCYEKHITVNKSLPGPDHRLSLNKKEFKKLVQNIRSVEKSIGNGNKKIENSEKNNALKLKKYLVANKNIIKGKKITSKDIVAKRTGGVGLSAAYYYRILNKISSRNYKKNTPLIK